MFYGVPLPASLALTGKDVEVLWVKGSGGDVGTMKLDGFATLYMEKLQHLKTIYRGEALKRRCLHLHIDFPDRERELVHGQARVVVPGCAEQQLEAARNLERPDRVHGAMVLLLRWAGRQD